MTMTYYMDMNMKMNMIMNMIMIFMMTDLMNTFNMIKEQIIGFQEINQRKSFKFKGLSDYQ